MRVSTHAPSTSSMRVSIHARRTSSMRVSTHPRNFFTMRVSIAFYIANIFEYLIFLTSRLEHRQHFEQPKVFSLSDPSM